MPVPFSEGARKAGAGTACFMPKSAVFLPKSLFQNPCLKEEMQKRPQSGEAGNGGE
jgi:hypothetical protein